jgi:hypothetical protein
VPFDLSDDLSLEVAYRLARTEVCWQARHAGRGIDTGRVREAVQLAQEKLTQFQGLKSKATLLTETANAIRLELDGIEKDIQGQLSRVLEELAEHDTPTADAS